MTELLPYQLILDGFISGLTNGQIARRERVGLKYVAIVLHSMGIKNKHASPINLNANFYKEKKIMRESIYKDFDNGMPRKKICEKYALCKSSVQKIIVDKYSAGPIGRPKKINKNE